MPRLVDADEFKRRALNYYPEYWEDVLDEMECINLVRCKDCKHLSCPDIRIAPEWYRICRLQGVVKSEDGFCDEGERKETEDDND